MRRFWPLYISAFPGLFVGVSLLYHTRNTIAKVVLVILSIIYYPYLLLNIKVEEQKRFLNVLTDTQVMPMLPYFISLRFHRDLLINAINLGFMLSTLVLLALLGKFYSFLIRIISISVIGIIPVYLVIYICSKLRYRI